MPDFTDGNSRGRQRWLSAPRLSSSKKAVIIYVPIPQQKVFQKSQIILVRELEKKFSGKHVVVIGERKILPKPTRKARNPLKQKRPRSRTLTAVYDAILEDLVFPAEIVGKRIRVKLDGSQLVKVHLDKNQQTTIEHKVDTFTSVYNYSYCRAVSVHHKKVIEILSYRILIFYMSWRT
ncbi:40S ribosomal protein S7-like [Drosophila guanche]|uniref:40S ribosomal protein S7-like n=1 Tax=Drosophila guanche TaxID=7266 RepID=UPI001472423F|nr:40S ribosomal protein S7-like [Drosophila guanche]